jgi:hypothetical protein
MFVFLFINLTRVINVLQQLFKYVEREPAQGHETAMTMLSPEDRLLVTRGDE